MTRSKILAFACGTALLTGLLFFGSAAVEPTDACAGNCQFDWWTVPEWGHASSCAAAENSCYSNAYSAASAECASINKGLCQVGTFTPSACYWGGGKWNVDCYLDYKCDGGPEFPF
jgi:hypothetical protein